jgi:hypothetical protein
VVFFVLPACGRQENLRNRKPMRGEEGSMEEIKIEEGQMGRGRK